MVKEQLDFTGSTLTVEINSWNDCKEGKKLFADLKGKSVTLAQMTHMGVLEKGTKGGKASVMFAFKANYQGEPVHLVAELTGTIFEMCSQVFENAKINFEKKNG